MYNYAYLLVSLWGCFILNHLIKKDLTITQYRVAFWPCSWSSSLQFLCSTRCWFDKPGEKMCSHLSLDFLTSLVKGGKEENLSK